MRFLVPLLLASAGFAAGFVFTPPTEVMVEPEAVICANADNNPICAVGICTPTADGKCTGQMPVKQCAKGTGCSDGGCETKTEVTTRTAGADDAAPTCGGGACATDTVATTACGGGACATDTLATKDCGGGACATDAVATATTKQCCGDCTTDAVATAGCADGSCAAPATVAQTTTPPLTCPSGMCMDDSAPATQAKPAACTKPGCKLAGCDLETASCNDRCAEGCLPPPLSFDVE